MILVFDIPSAGSGGLLAEALLEFKIPYVLLVRNKARTSASWSDNTASEVVMHECSPFTIEGIEAYLQTLGPLPVRGVLCALDPLMPIAAHFAQRYSVPFTRPEAILRWTDKGISRRFCLAANLPVPHFRWVDATDETSLASWTHYPAIIKPRHSSGSLGTKRVNSMEEVIRFFSHLHKSFSPDDWLIEALLSGAIYSVEGYMCKGELHFLGISDRTWGPQPYFVEDGLNFPVLQGTALAQTLYDTAQAAIIATEYHHGFFHVELIVHQNKPYIVELNPRYGGRVPVMASLVFQRNFFGELFSLCCGNAPTFGLPQKGASAFYVFPHKQGVWQGFNSAICAHYPNLKVVRYNVDRKIGDVLGPVFSIRDNLMLVFFEAETAELSHAITRAFLSEVPMYLHIEPQPAKRRTKTKPGVLAQIKRTWKGLF